MDVAAADRIFELEARIERLETQLDGITSVVAALQPLEQLLARYNVSEQQRRVLYGIINEMANRLERNEITSFAEFEERVTFMIGQLRGDRRFVELVIQAIRVERPALTRLYEHFTVAMALLRN
jgi:hypothetical protein